VARAAHFAALSRESGAVSEFGRDGGIERVTKQILVFTVYGGGEGWRAQHAAPTEVLRFDAVRFVVY
jgi:hypothetical protein